MIFSILFLLGCNVYSLERLPKELEEMMQTSIENDHANKVTCKKPSVSTVVKLWEAHNDECIMDDPNEFLSIQFNRHLFTTASEFREEFRYIWGNYSEKAWGTDSWKPISGVGINDKNGVKHMIYNNLDTVFILGTQKQFNLTRDAVLEDHGPEGPVDVYQFITNRIGGLLSACLISNDAKLIEKLYEAGDVMLEMYANWYPYKIYDLNKKKGTYGKIPLKAIINISEIQALYKYTKDPRYLDLIETITGNLTRLQDYKILPRYAMVKNGEIEFVDSITSDYSSVEIQKILLNNWLLSGQKIRIFKDLYDKTKDHYFNHLTFINDKRELILSESNSDKVNYKMNLKMCGWAGILAQESLINLNVTEIRFAENLIGTCSKLFNLKSLPSDYLSLEKERITLSGSKFSIPSELFESSYLMYKATSNLIHRKSAYYVFAAIKNVCGKQYGFSMTDKDLMPQDFLSKTLKYMFLLFAEDHQYRRVVISPSGHLLGEI
jgi:mannosyl-oligosaccharide alpha-1,2-mannosidase